MVGKGEKVVSETTSQWVIIWAVSAGGCKFMYTIVVGFPPDTPFEE